MRKQLIRNVKSLKFTSDRICNYWPKEKVFINERLKNLVHEAQSRENRKNTQRS